MLSINPPGKRSPEFYAQFRERIAAQADALDETFVDTQKNSKDVYVQTSMWNKGEGSCSSTESHKSLERRDGYLTYAVTTEDVNGKQIGTRRVQFFELAEGGYRVQDFDGKSITETLLPA